MCVGVFYLWSHNHWYLVQLYSFFFNSCIFFFFFFKQYLFSLIVEYRGCSEVTVCGLLSAVASLAAEHGRADFSGFRLRLQSAGSVIVARGLSVWTPSHWTVREALRSTLDSGEQ